MKIWVDDVRPAPDGYTRAKTTKECIDLIKESLIYRFDISLIDLDHDAGAYVAEGGDYIEILKWIEIHNLLCLAEGSEWDVVNTTFHIHSMNPVGVQNMRAIIRHNGWKEI